MAGSLPGLSAQVPGRMSRGRLTSPTSPIPPTSVLPHLPRPRPWTLPVNRGIMPRTEGLAGKLPGEGLESRSPSPTDLCPPADDLLGGCPTAVRLLSTQQLPFASVVIFMGGVAA